MESLDSLLDQWLTDLEIADRSSKTILRYGGIARSFLAWASTVDRRTVTLKDLTPILFMEYRSQLQAYQSPATVNVHIAALRAWCQWLLANRHLAENPARNLKQIGQPALLAPEPLSNSAVNALLREAQRSRHGPRNYAIFQMLLQTGMRIGECQQLHYSDITLKERKGSVLIRSGKGNKSRTIPLNSSVRWALIEYVAWMLGCPPLFRAVTESWPKSIKDSSVRPLWESQKKAQLSAVAMWRVIHNVVEQCAKRELVPEQTKPHDLRHTFAHRYLQKNPGDLVGLARILGHESLDTTKIYTQPTAGELAHRVEEIPLNAYH